MLKGDGLSRRYLYTLMSDAAFVLYLAIAILCGFLAGLVFASC